MNFVPKKLVILSREEIKFRRKTIFNRLIITTGNQPDE